MNYTYNYDDCKPMQQYYSDRCSPLEVLYERRCARYIYIVPDGLRELMSDITREVLRCQPMEIYCFIADYLDALMITRENARVAAMFVEDVTEAGCTIRDILHRTNLTIDLAVKSVKIIQRAFRKHLEKSKPSGIVEPIDPQLVICKMILRLNISHQTAADAAKIIQQAWRAYKTRIDKWRARFDNAIEWREAARYTLRMYKTYAATWEYTRAATIIQAAYRGYYTRKLLKEYLSRKKPKHEDIELLEYLTDQYEDQPEETDSFGRHGLSGHTSITDASMETLYVMYDPEDKAARIIQRTFKKYVRRVTMTEQTTSSKMKTTQDDDMDVFSEQPIWTADDLQILEQQIRREIDE